MKKVSISMRFGAAVGDDGDVYINSDDLWAWTAACKKNKRSGAFMRNFLFRLLRTTKAGHEKKKEGV